MKNKMPAKDKKDMKDLKDMKQDKKTIKSMVKPGALKKNKK